MSFYIEKAIFVNRAPFDKIELDFKESGINVLSAINGRGKTTVLSHITDAFYELAKQAFHGEFEGKENWFYTGQKDKLDRLNQLQPCYQLHSFLSWAK